MEIALRQAKEQDIPVLWEMQVRAFRPLLEKYQDHSTNPAAESLSRFDARFYQPCTDYYLIFADDEAVGGVRVIRRKNGRCNIAPLFVLPEHQNQGIAQAAVRLLEQLYPGVQWDLNTILQEEGNCHFYEKLGYLRTGEYEYINERMTLVYYRKMSRPG